MQRPVIFLDVDGVLSPMVADSSAWTDWERVEGLPFHLVLSREMGRRIAALDAEVVWLTTWEHDANTVICEVLGWEPNTVLEPGELGEGWWKLDAIRRRIGTGPRPFVWVDDELEHRWDAVEGWLRGLEVPSLTLSPRPEVGLTEDQLDQIERFIEDPGGYGQ